MWMQEELGSSVSSRYCFRSFVSAATACEPEEAGMCAHC